MGQKEYKLEKGEKKNKEKVILSSVHVRVCVSLR